MQALRKVDRALQQATDAKEVPGVVAVAATDADIIYEGAFGLRDLSKAEPMTVDTVFWIASMTKAVTSTAAMQLVDQGKLDLDEPIGNVLPDLASPRVFEGFDEKGAPQLRPAKRPITLRQLMTHTAGFCYEIWHGGMLQYMGVASVPSTITCEKRSLTVPLVGDPGERWEYGISIDFVGKAIEEASGQKLDAYFNDHIFTPLGMKDTNFRLRPDQRTRLAAMHARGADGALAPIPFEIAQQPEVHMGGHGLYGTALDYAAFLRMLLNGGSLNGHQVLKPETVKTMAENHIGELNVMPLKTALPQYSTDVELYPGQDKKWGLSFLINTQKTAEGRSAGSLAWAGLANTYFWIDPTARVAGVILMQFLPFADKTALDIFAAFERGVYGGMEGTRQAA